MHEKEHRESGKRRQHRSDHDDAVVRVVGGGEGRDDQRDRLGLVRLQHDQRPEIVVPGGHEDDDEGRRIGGTHHRHVDEQEDLPFFQAVDLCRVAKFGRKRFGALPEIEDDEGRADRRQQHRQMRVDDAGLAHHDEKRDHQRSKGDHQREQHHPIETLAIARPEHLETVAGQRRHGERQDRGENCNLG